MRKNILATLLLVFSISLSAEESIKTGNNLGVLPAISYNSDLGIQYGAILNLFNYGDGSRYPAYNHSLYLELSRYTKGSGIYRLYYDSEKLLPGIRSFMEVSYLTDDLMDFYGYNGYQSNYSSTLEKSNRVFYKLSQKQIRILADFKGSILRKEYYWIASYNFENYKTAPVNYSKLNKGIDPGDTQNYLPGISLYEKYVQWGLIESNIAKGGILHAFKAGLVRDTRNALNNPDKGSYSEALIEVAPSFLNEHPYTRYSLVHRQYQSIIKKKLNAAVRLGIQGKIGNDEIPFFRRTQLMSPFATRTNVTGLGGTNSLRGILRNRITGDAFALGNFELRWKAVTFKWGKQNFYVGVNSFFDTGLVLDPIDWNLTNVSNEDLSSYFRNEKKDTFHSSFGGGLKVAMNENFIISAEFGKAMNQRDGAGLGSYISLNYLF